MTEEGLGVPGDMFLHIFPVAFIGANLFAIGTYGKKSTRGFNAGAKGKMTGYRDQLSEPPGELAIPFFFHEHGESEEWKRDRFSGRIGIV
jgi:hypothetical protein